MRRTRRRAAVRAARAVRIADARRAAPEDLDELLTPRESDTRVVRLAKAAARSLLDEGSRVTRASLIASARSIEPEGMAESTIDDNAEVRVIYDRARGHSPAPPRRRRDGVPGHLLRATRAELVRQLDDAHAACERELRRIEDADARLDGRLTCSREGIERATALRARRRTHASNPQPPALATASDGRRATSLVGITRAVKQAERKGLPLTDAALAAAAGVSPSTLLRNLEGRTLILEARARRARVLVPDPPPTLPPAPASRGTKRDLARSLALEREALALLRIATGERTAALFDLEDAALRALAREEAERGKASVDWLRRAFPED